MEQEERGVITVVTKEIDPKIKGLRFNEIFFSVWAKEDWDTIDLDSFKSSKNGITATIKIKGESVRDAEFAYPEPIKSEEFLTYLIEDLKRFNNWTGEVKVEEVQKDMVDEELLVEAKAIHNPIEVLMNKGFVRGAIVARSNGGPVQYGIFTGEFYPSSEDTVGLRFTDGRDFHQDYCTLVDDVNKHILRMVEAEQGRIMENAHMFIETIHQKVQEIIYE